MDGVDKFGRSMRKRYHRSSNKIEDPSVDTDAVNKKYVDHEILQCISQYENVKSYVDKNCLASIEGHHDDDDEEDDSYYNAKSMRINSLASPLEATDAVNLHTLKKYVHDNTVMQSIENEKNFFDARSMRINAIANPLEDTDAVNLLTLKKYVQDNAVVHAQDKINFRNSRISNIGDAEMEEDAINLRKMKEICAEIYGFFEISLQSYPIPHFLTSPGVPTFAWYILNNHKHVYTYRLPHSAVCHSINIEPKNIVVFHNNQSIDINIPLILNPNDYLSFGVERVNDSNLIPLSVDIILKYECKPSPQ